MLIDKNRDKILLTFSQSKGWTTKPSITYKQSRKVYDRLSEKQSPSTSAAVWLTRNEYSINYLKQKKCVHT